MQGKTTTLCLLAILAAGLVLRFVLLGVLWTGNPERVIRPDSLGYENSALALLEEGRFATAPTPDAKPMFKRTPGYPAFIAAVYALSGTNRLSLCSIQIMLSVLVPLCCFWMGKRLFSEFAGLTAAAFVTFDPVMIASNIVIMSETLFSVIMALVLLMTIRWRDTDRKVLAAVWIGVLLAAATYVRPVAYYLVLPVAFSLFFLCRRSRCTSSSRFLSALACLFVCICLLGLWHIRNFQVFGSPQFSGVAGINMLQYRAADVYADRHGTSRQEASRILLEQLETRQDITGHQTDREMAYGMELLLQDIPGTIRSTAKGMFRSLLGPGAGLLVETVGGADTSTIGMLRRLIQAPLASFSKTPWEAVTLIWAGAFLIVLYALSAIGIMVCLAHTHNRGMHLTLLLIVCYFLAISSGGETYSRFRISYLPILALYAGMGANVVLGRLGRHRPLG